jgi:hypothetical protein
MVFAFAISLATPACAIITSDEAGSHVVVPGQPAFGVNLDGVALIGRRLPNVNTFTTLTPICSAALISHRHLLCAAHCFDVDSDGAVDEIYTAITHTAAFELADGLVTPESDSWGDLDFLTRVSYFRNFLETATGGAAMFVPAPGGSLLVLIASIIGWLHRQNRFGG